MRRHNRLTFKMEIPFVESIEKGPGRKLSDDMTW